jgi:hypothetical protein
MDMTQRQSNDRSTALRLLGCQFVIQSVVLKQLVALTRNMKCGAERSTDLDILELIDISLKQLIDLLLVLSEVVVLELGVIWYHRVVDLGVDELDDAVDEVTEVLEELVVVRCDEAIPFEFRVASFGSM